MFKLQFICLAFLEYLLCLNILYLISVFYANLFLLITIEIFSCVVVVFYYSIQEYLYILRLISKRIDMNPNQKLTINLIMQFQKPDLKILSIVYNQNDTSQL